VNEEKAPFVSRGRQLELGYDYPGAIEAYHRALENHPNNSVAHYRLGWLYEREDRDPAAAIYHLQRYLKLRPNSENADMIRQRVVGCKQSLVKDVALGHLNEEMQTRMSELVEQNLRLSEENQRLTDQIARLQSGIPPKPTAPATAPSTLQRRPPPSPATAAATGKRIHTVQKGDTYYSIAKRYRVSSTALQAANPGIDPTRLKIGQQLVVPAQ
jgi:LysM repeat protein